MADKEKVRNALRVMAQRNELTATQLEGLHEVARGGMLQKTLPAKVRDRLIDLGYIEQKLGGLAATSKGKLYAASHKK